MTPPKPTFDPGLTQKYTGALNRTVNDDGQFNVKRRGSSLRDIHPYLFLITVPLWVFVAIVMVAFVLVNLAFAGFYMATGIEHLKGAEAPTTGLQFLNAFFFSTHTLTTVGYGSIYPTGVVANAVASFEALIGLMAFALATGLLFGRFSRPSARVGYSQRMLVAPYEKVTSLQFRIVNRRSNVLLDLSARVLLMTVESVDGRLQRRFAQLELEREQVAFLPLTWTIVHPISPSSPLYGKTKDELRSLQAEFVIALKAFDETFGQVVNSRHSYRHDEIVWNAKFTPAFDIDDGGDLWLRADRVSSFEALIETPPKEDAAAS